MEKRKASALLLWRASTYLFHNHLLRNALPNLTSPHTDSSSRLYSGIVFNCTRRLELFSPHIEHQMKNLKLSFPISRECVDSISRRCLQRSLGRQFQFYGSIATSAGRNPLFSEVNSDDISYFKSIIGENNVIHDEDWLESANTDWMNKYKGSSKLLLLPKSTEEVSHIMRYCNSRRLAVVPQGGNTGLVGGSVPVFDEVIVNTSSMSKIISFDKERVDFNKDLFYYLPHMPMWWFGAFLYELIRWSCYNAFCSRPRVTYKDRIKEFIMKMPTTGVWENLSFALHCHVQSVGKVGFTYRELLEFLEENEERIKEEWSTLSPGARDREAYLVVQAIKKRSQINLPKWDRRVKVGNREHHDEQEMIEYFQTHKYRYMVETAAKQWMHALKESELWLPHDQEERIRKGPLRTVKLEGIQVIEETEVECNFEDQKFTIIPIHEMDFWWDEEDLFFFNDTVVEYLQEMESDDLDSNLDAMLASINVWPVPEEWNHQNANEYVEAIEITTDEDAPRIESDSEDS